MTHEEIQEVLRLHSLWLANDPAGKRAVLSYAVLRGAVLSYAVLRGAVLSYAVLRGADLRGADLSGANLRDADLSYAVLRGADLPPVDAARLSIVPETGQFNGWKKLKGEKIAELEIPHDAARSNATGRKCRASHARVLRIVAPDGLPADEGVSLHDPAFLYRVGETVKCHAWEPNRWVECGGGIHFYLTIEEAKAHV
jgi:hypothetical protein